MSWLILLALLKKLDKKIDDLETVTFRKVDELPATGEANVIYFVPKETAEEGNYSDEYIWVSASETYEQIGDSMIDPLPEVSAADNGKVLGVANGIWDKISFNKDIDIFQIENYSGTTYNLKNGKTMQDLLNTYQSGKIGLLKYVESGITNYYISLSSMYYILIDDISVTGEYNNKGIKLDTFRKNSWGGSTNKLTRKQFHLPAEMPMADYAKQKELYVAEGGVIGYHTPNIANIYNTNSTYELGDLCIYNGNLYECTTAITTAEAWTAAHWTQVKVSDELNKKANSTDIPADANHNIASAYDSTATYAVGDLCIYNGNLYECSTAISTAEAWDSTHWTQKTVAEELSNSNDSNIIFHSRAGDLTDCTIKDIYDSFIAGKLCFIRDDYNWLSVVTYARYSNNEYYIIAHLARNDSSSYPRQVSFGALIYKGSANTTNRYEYTYFPLRITNGTPLNGQILMYSSAFGDFTNVDIPSQLPAVASSDEGKVLTVNSNGQWVASALPDGTNQQY